MHFTKGRGTVWRPITNHSSDSFNPFISISDKKKEFVLFCSLSKERKKIIPDSCPMNYFLLLTCSLLFYSVAFCFLWLSVSHGCAWVYSCVGSALFFDVLTWFGKKMGHKAQFYWRAPTSDSPLAIPIETSAWKLEGQAYAQQQTEVLPWYFLVMQIYFCSQSTVVFSNNLEAN